MIYYLILGFLLVYFEELNASKNSTYTCHCYCCNKTLCQLITNQTVSVNKYTTAKTSCTKGNYNACASATNEKIRIFPLCQTNQEPVPVKILTNESITELMTNNTLKAQHERYWKTVQILKDQNTKDNTTNDTQPASDEFIEETIDFDYDQSNNEKQFEIGGNLLLNTQNITVAEVINIEIDKTDTPIESETTKTIDDDLTTESTAMTTSNTEQLVTKSSSNAEGDTNQKTSTSTVSNQRTAESTSASISIETMKTTDESTTSTSQMQVQVLTNEQHQHTVSSDVKTSVYQYDTITKVSKNSSQFTTKTTAQSNQTAIIPGTTTKTAHSTKKTNDANYITAITTSLIFTMATSLILISL